ncbi:putative octanoyltransferase [Colletotrichum orbiculare MAFF 240422]|uniref:lipoyl(octanoyl) transferase n=1 Tax=Colletotrichum orbiculare (strain 104-T / ATCC 96160 / CBS 514.97 / LARS 414 / MAFF 240422) TaxID=1213857 RepID=N4VC79_COLOR|nr:putative octanoyltransferase [Colletotrichum orbiculare MAFF 240422]
MRPPALRLPRPPRHLLPSQSRARHVSSNTLSSLVFPTDAPPNALRHIRLTTRHEPFPSYTAASDFQTALRQLFLAWKSSPTAQAPSPAVISFTPKPTYTLGRRQKALTTSQTARLRAPLLVPTPHGEQNFTPDVVTTDRGGLTTYHGPGQILLWPVLDLRSTLFPPLTVRSYARLLETTTQAVCSELGIATYLSEADPGVWVESARTDRGGERKIAAMGVHLRRHISGLGTALNVDVQVAGPETRNPWARFVPCGLDGKTATSVAAEMGGEEGEVKDGGWYATRWTEVLAGELGVEYAGSVDVCVDA